LAAPREPVVAARLARHRTRRGGRPEEVGALVAYLAPHRADFIQGALINIDGGSTRAV
jgi:NAD(P)-dependent dehydrogenase (short-subunit alcohol dehydrogenase family)